MRQLNASFFVTLDGVMEAPEKWQFPYFDDDIGAAIGAAMMSADAFLLGRVTYQEWAAHWPTAQDQFADYMNATPKHVVSTTLETVEWANSHLVTGDVAAAVSALKQQPGKDITISGSATLVRSLLRDGLVDELRLMVCPLLLGSGRRLFDDIRTQLPLELVSAQTFSTGVQYLVYRPARG